MEIHLRQMLGTGYGITREDAEIIRSATLRYLRKGQRVTLRFDTMKVVTQDFIVSLLASLTDTVSAETVLENLRFRGFPMKRILVLEIIVQTWLDLPRELSVTLRKPEAMLRVSRLITA
jgi:hypothetical protein